MIRAGYQNAVPTVCPRFAPVSIEESCLDRLILFGEGSLCQAVTEFVTHYQTERPRQA